LENELLKIDFSSKGAQPQNVLLKKYKKFDSTQVVLQSGPYNELGYTIAASSTQTAQTKDIIFTTEPVQKLADGSQVLNFISSDSTGRKITHQYIMKPNDYMVNFNIILDQSDRFFTNNVMNIHWKTETPQIEKDYKYETTQTHIIYVEDNNYDFEYLGSGDNLNFKKPLNWVGV